MRERQIPRDDLLDVVEIVDQLNEHIDNILEENTREIAICALINSLTNNLIFQCSTLPELILYRNMLVKILDRKIRSVKLLRDLE